MLLIGESKMQLAKRLLNNLANGLFKKNSEKPLKHSKKRKKITDIQRTSFKSMSLIFLTSKNYLFPRNNKDSHADYLISYARFTCYYCNKSK